MVASGVGASTGDVASAVLSGQVAQNAVENNYLSKKQVNEFNSKLNALINGTKFCRDKACVDEISKERNKLIEEYRTISKKQDVELKSLCSSQPNSSACSSGLKEAISYNGSVSAENKIARNTLNDRNTSSNNTLNIIYNSPNAKLLLNDRISSVTDRANFFGMNDYYFNENGVKTKWFAVAENTSRTLLGAEGYGLSGMFSLGNYITKPFVDTTYFEWRKEAGDSLMLGGFVNFANLYNGNYSSIKQWDIKQLKEEQKLLQPIHEKHLEKDGLVDKFGKPIMKGSILKYEDRIDYGCKKMGYSSNDGCKP